MSKDDLGGLPYQQASVVRQLLAEKANAEALGLSDRVAAADKQLAGLGYKPAAARSVSREQAPESRQARHERVQKAADDKPDDKPAARPSPARHKA